jgi:PAS domain S-box-containing protein
MSEKPTYEELLRKLQEYEEVFRDLSTLRKTEEALQGSEKKYRRLVESLERDYIIYSHDRDGNFTYLSPSVVNVLGYSQDEFMGHYAAFITDSPINKDVEEHTNAGLRGEKQEPYEAEFWHKNGNRVHMRVTEVPLFDDNGNVLGIEGIVQDITKLKRAEADRESAIKKLEKALSEIKTLRGILPLCSFCKKIRDDKGYWEQVDVYINKHSEADISHSICPECLKNHYPDWYEKVNPD